MARRKKRSGRRILAGFIALLIIGVIGYSFFVDDPIGLTTLVGGVTDQFPISTGNADFWALPASFYFAITPNNGINCWIAPTLTQGNIDGTQETLASSSGQGIQLFEITGGFFTSAKEVRFVKDSPRMSCEDQSGQGRDIRLVGGTIVLESFVRDKVTGVETKVDSSGIKIIPALNRNLNVATGGGNILLPTLTTQASVIESFIVVPDTVASRNIDVIFRTSSFAQINVVGEFTPVADLKTSIGGLLKFINPDFGSSLPPTQKGTQVTMTQINPIQHYYIGNSGQVPTGVTSSSQIVTLNDEIRATFTGTQDNWSASEGIPTLTIKDPRGITRASGIPMTTISTLSGGITEFKRIGVSVPTQINDNNIDQLKGTWTAQMIQAGRTQIGAKTFALMDARPIIVDPPPTTCPTGQTLLVNGVCQDVPTSCPTGQVRDPITNICQVPPPNSCPSATEQGVTVVAMSDADLIASFNDLKAKQSAGTLTSCENTTLILVSAQVSSRNLDTTPPPTGSSTGTAFIRYSSSLTDELGNVGGGGGCPLTGKVPADGLPITGLQLLGIGTCDGLRFGSVELTPTLDFGSSVSGIIIDSSSFIVRQELFLAKNNPYPAKPTVECTTPTSTSAGNCAVTNHAFSSDKVGDVALTPSEVTFVRNFVDKATSGEYQVTKVVLQENSLIDKIQRNGVALTTGDEVSLMYLTWGTFRGTINGAPFVGAVPAMTFVQSFTFQSGIGGVTCDAPSQRVVFANDGSVTEFGGQGGQCLPCQELEDLGLVSSCPTTEMCPAGTSGTFPECNIIDICAVPPNRIVNGVCLPPLDGTCPVAGQIRDPITNECRDTEMCFQDPVCTSNEKFEATPEKDDCGANILICVPISTPPPPPPPREPCPNPDTQFRDSLGMCVTINPTGCEEGESRNSLGLCEPTGTLECPLGFTGTVPNCVPDGTDPKPVNFCQIGAEGFNFSQCLSSIFSRDAEGLQIGGTTQTALTVVVMLAILLIVIAVIIRRRRGGGFGS